MEISYNLRYQKYTFSNRSIIDKEGEIVIYEKGFRLKGKGASDKGELINFSDVKEFYNKDDKLFFISFSKEKYILSEAGTLFSQMMKDLYKARNEFLLDALFMRAGKLKAEFEGSFERSSKFGKFINKGEGKIRLYDKSLVVIPVLQDAFSVNFNFVNFYEFDEDEYILKIVLEDGQSVLISHLGDDFVNFQEKMDLLLGGMYESVVNDVLREAFPYYDTATLLKVAKKMKGGKTVPRKEIVKIDKELSASFDEFFFENPGLKEKVDYLLSADPDSEVRFGITKDETYGGSFLRWLIVSVPMKNLVSFMILPRNEKSSSGGGEKSGAVDAFFFKIIMERGRPQEKTEDKIHEVEQSLLILNFAKDPCYKDKRELKFSPYLYAIRKMPFLRILRKSFEGKAFSEDFSDWKRQVDEILKSAEISE